MLNQCAERVAGPASKGMGHPRAHDLARESGGLWEGELEGKAGLRVGIPPAIEYVGKGIYGLGARTGAQRFAPLAQPGEGSGDVRS